MQFQKLKQFITTDMRMAQVYQPVMLIELLENNGEATVQQIAQAILDKDPTQIEYFSEIAKNVVAKLFKRIVAETKIVEKTDKKPTLYSLRHTSIMMRLINGNVNTLALARNARTSQAMIDKFYAAHLTTNQVRQQLHGFTEKKPPSKNTPEKNKTDPNTNRVSSKTVRNSPTREDTK